MINLNNKLKITKYTNKFKFNLHDGKKYNSFCSKISSLLRKHNIKNSNKEYYRAVGNAVHHGKCPVKCKIYINSDDGTCTIIITDKGNGFDYKETCRKFNSGEKYFNYHGKGMKVYNRNQDLSVNWDKSGKRIWLNYS